jgi:hypothetical protein
MSTRTILAIAVIAILPVTALAVDYKKTYCGKQDYVGNTGAKYAHLHCGKSFFTLSRGKKDHINFNGRGNCNKVDEVLADKDNQYGTAADMQAITTALEAYKAQGCL